MIQIEKQSVNTKSTTFEFSEREREKGTFSPKNFLPFISLSPCAPLVGFTELLLIKITLLG